MSKYALFLFFLLPSVLLGQELGSPQIIKGKLEYKLDNHILVDREFLLTEFAPNREHNMSLVPSGDTYDIAIGDRLKIFGDSVVVAGDSTSLLYKGRLENGDADLPLTGFAEVEISIQKKIKVEFRIEVYGFDHGWFKNWVFRGKVKGRVEDALNKALEVIKSKLQE